MRFPLRLFCISIAHPDGFCRAPLPENGPEEQKAGVHDLKPARICRKMYRYKSGETARRFIYVYPSSYEREMKILPSVCDWAGRLSVWDTFALFMDMATEHADALGIGLKDLAKRDLFWLTVKTKVHFLKRPKMGELVTVSTWPEPPQLLRCNRDYSVFRNGETILTGKTEWAVMNMKTGKLQKAEEIYPPELVLLDRRVMPEPFARLRCAGEEETFGTYTVRSTDIDIGGHMNNAAYVRAFAGLLDTAQWKSMLFSDLEVHFRTQCFEGDTLTFRRSASENGCLVQAYLPDGRTAVQIQIS